MNTCYILVNINIYKQEILDFIMNKTLSRLHWNFCGINLVDYSFAIKPLSM